MHIVIDLFAIILLLFLLLSGWHKGFILSILSAVRMVLAYGIAYLSGRYLGLWLGEISHRPRLITMPICAIVGFGLTLFFFHVLMTEIKARHQNKEEKNDFQRPRTSCISGAIINLIAGGFSMAILFWFVNLLLISTSDHAIPGAERSQFGAFSQRTVYELSNAFMPNKKGNESQVAALSRTLSNPEQGNAQFKEILADPTIQSLLSDPQFRTDLLSGDAHTVEQNELMQQLFNQPDTMKLFRDIGLISPKETPATICQKLTKFSQNKEVQISIENLRNKGLLNTKYLSRLIRDPDFDNIVTVLLK